MGSHMNFRSFGDTDNTTGDSSSRKPPENVTLVRQPSIYSLTFDELQNTIGGIGKDFGSMNMDELLKNIWTAEETQALAVASSTGGGGGGEGNNNNNPSGNLQKQGSLTLPRTLSQKTVDEVWRDLIKDSGVADGNGNGSGSGGSGSTMPQTQRQQTLGEVTLEEFLVRAGVVREDMPQQFARPNSNLWFGDLSRPNNNTGLVLGFQQPNGNKGNLGNGNTPVSRHPPALSLHANPTNPQQQAQHQQHQQPPPLFPKPANVAFAPSVHLLNSAQLASSGTRGGMIRVQGGAALPSVAVAGGSPAGQISPEVFAKSTVDTSSLSPVPYVINRGRKCSAIEKVVERRQRRMIKNRESAARSRARKQAYTLELEAEVQKLKEMNRELETKQAEIMEMQKNQALETMYRPWGCKRQCLRRTLTGPW